MDKTSISIISARPSVDTLCPKSVDFWSLKSFRFFVTLLMGLSIVAHALARATISIGMVCMVNGTASLIRMQDENGLNSNRSTQANQCGDTSSAAADYGGDQAWTNSEQSVIFSSINWGGVLSAIPAGIIADRYSAKAVVTYCLLMQALGCLLSPVSITYGGMVPFCIVRFIMGIGGQSVINPAIAVIIARWFPPNERSTVIGLYSGVFITGNQIAFIAAMPLNAWLCQNKQFLGGWPAIFYVTGMAIFIAIIPWWIFISDKPQSNRWVSKSELRHIEYGLRLQQLGNAKGMLRRVPWLKMLTSMAVWACIISNLAGSMHMSILESYTPTFYKQILHLDLKSNGLLSAIPYLCQWMSKILFAGIADMLKTRTTINHNTICKVFNCFNTFIGGAFVIASGYAGCGQVAFAVAMLSLSNFFSSGQVCGFWTSVACMAPAYTGIVNSLVRIAGQVAAILAPSLVGEIVLEGTQKEWKTVYFVTFAGLVLSGIQYLIFGTIDIQPWAETNVQPDVPKKAIEECENGCAKVQPIDITNVITSPNKRITKKGLDSSRETVISVISEKL